MRSRSDLNYLLLVAVVLDWVVFELNEELQLVRVRHVQVCTILPYSVE